MSQQPLVTFNYDAWVARYPEFSGVSEPLAQLYWNEATLYFNAYGWPGSLPQAPTLLNMLTAHIAKLNAPLGGSPSPQTVGRVDNASEGSVSVHLDMGDANEGSPSQAWYMTTKYGAAYWAATAKFRTARYRPPPFPGSFVPTALYTGRGFVG